MHGYSVLTDIDSLISSDIPLEQKILWFWPTDSNPILIQKSSNPKRLCLISSPNPNSAPDHSFLEGPETRWCTKIQASTGLSPPLEL